MSDHTFFPLCCRSPGQLHTVQRPPTISSTEHSSRHLSETSTSGFRPPMGASLSSPSTGFTLEPLHSIPSYLLQPLLCHLRSSKFPVGNTILDSERTALISISCTGQLDHPQFCSKALLPHLLDVAYQVCLWPLCSWQDDGIMEVVGVPTLPTLPPIGRNHLPCNTVH